MALRECVEQMKESGVVVVVGTSGVVWWAPVQWCGGHLAVKLIGESSLCAWRETKQ